jgi:type IV fimbrial biogenesis protein FimT
MDADGKLLDRSQGRHMRQLSRSGASAGFTLVEALIAMVVMGILLAVGVPKMNHLIQARKAASLSEMYTEGIRIARQQALTHNASTRLVLTTNASNGQWDWQVDLCFAALNVACTKTTGSWSTTSAPSAADPEGTTGYRSVARSADGMPSSTIVAPTILPAGASKVYFNSLGWVDTNISGNITRLTLTPAAGYTEDIHASALVVTLAGTVIKCDPTSTNAARDSRACP